MVWIESVRDWNASCFCVNPNLSVSVNWTCEGLKLAMALAFLRASFVWIEPVRDWNISCSYLKLSRFSSVNWTCEGLKLYHLYPPFFVFTPCELNLWGIETLTAKPIIGFILIVWIEPVRDWNLKSHPSTAFFTNRVNWTCEGLKHIFNLLLLPKEQVCELNLWGIETFIYIHYNRT